VRIDGAPTDDASRRDRFGGTTCVVTGGLGFIGSNLVHLLASAGATVRVIDALVPTHGGSPRNLEGVDGTVDVLEADIGDDRVGAVVRDADTVFNLAGQVSHLDSMTDPEGDLFRNTITHGRFLETMRRENRTARIVHASTRQVYGRPIRVPVDEQHPTRPLDVNGVAKLAGEQLHLVYAHVYDMPITSLRLTNVFGPRQRLTSNELGFLPVFVRTALQGGTIQLFGDGSQRRDCLYIDDVLDALVLASGPAGCGEVYNVGHHRSHTLAEIADILGRIGEPGTSVTTTPWPGDHQRIDIGSFQTDSSAIERTVGWGASVDIETGLQRTLDFYRRHPWYLSST
jgi:nucleoside-diphosphate-sugar epimerase